MGYGMDVLVFDRMGIGLGYDDYFGGIVIAEERWPFGRMVDKLSEGEKVAIVRMAIILHGIRVSKLRMRFGQRGVEITTRYWYSHELDGHSTEVEFRISVEDAERYDKMVALIYLDYYGMDNWMELAVRTDQSCCL